MLPTMSEIEILSQAHDEASLAHDQAREKVVLFSRAVTLIEELCGGCVEVSRRLTADQFDSYMIVLRAQTAAYEELSVAITEDIRAFHAYYKAAYGIDLDAVGAAPESQES